MIEVSKLTVLFNNANADTDSGMTDMLSYVMVNGGKHAWNNGYGLYSRVLDRGTNPRERGYDPTRRIFCVTSKRAMHKELLASMGYYPTAQGKKSDSDYLASFAR